MNDPANDPDVRTVKDLRALIADLPDDYYVGYHSYDKGCGHTNYRYGWVYVDHKHKGLLLNPGVGFDDRFPASIDDAIRRRNKCT